MKRFIIGVILLLLALLSILFTLRLVRHKIDNALNAPSGALSSPTPQIDVATSRSDTTLFVPYWTLDEGDFTETKYRDYIYFGLGVSEDGVNRKDDGYRNLDTFVSKAPAGSRLLAIRMIDNKISLPVLKDKIKQAKVITESIAIAKENGFSGIVLDLEVTGLPFSSLIDQITAFNKEFYNSSKKAKLSYGITAYGDTFYRVRPFSVEELAKSTDKIYIMAYDFYKANGNPGPNFPLAGQEKYGYDYERMINGFLQATKSDKLAVVFGMYGYDWEVDDAGKSKGMGEAISLKESTATLIKGCGFTSCSWERDSDSSEIKVMYSDKDAKHIVWTEDIESVKRKKEFLQKKGIGSFAYWAYSYF